MKTEMRNRVAQICAFLLVCVSASVPAAWAQRAAVASRVTAEVDDTRTVRMEGNVHPLARREFDRGALADSQPMTRMLLLLQRSAEQEIALRQLMDAQMSKGSANYHAWLTPEQFGKQFGPSDADVQAVTDWLTRQGFQIAKVGAGRTTIEFSGNVAQVRNAFHTEMHRFAVKGEEHFANTRDPEIPEALAPVVKGVVALHNFPKQSHARKVGQFQRDLATGQVKALFTYTDLNGTFYGVGPADFAKIYKIPSTATGAGQKIAIVGQSNINIQDVRDFRTIFGLPANDPQIILNGPDPGLVPGDEGESDLDVELAGGVAPNAQIIFVTSQSTSSNQNSTQVSVGIDLSALYIIDNNLAPVMSESYGECEAGLGTAGNAFYNAMWEQATAQGITVSISSGDNGSAACDPAQPPASQFAASLGIAVSGFASTPFNVAIGGTDFDQFNIETTFWNSTNTPGTQLSAKGYIPEIPWDDSLCAANFPATCTSLDSQGGDIIAGGGGPSSVYAKPAFQTGLGDAKRDIPDVSFFASDGFNSSFYIVCQSDVNPGNAPCDLSTSVNSGTHNFSGVGGTSAGAPSFAAIMALVNQSEVAQGRSGRQGNANFVLYALANAQKALNCNATGPAATCVFNDVEKGNNAVACVAGTPNCSNTGSGFGVLIASANTPAFKAGAGYDLATGLGSINVANLLASWSTVGRTATTTTLSGASGAAITAGQTFSVMVTVTPAGATGDISLIANVTGGTQQGVGSFALSGGTVTASTNLLPAGTTTVQAFYGGDATHAASTSAPLALAIAGANATSQVTASYVGFDTNNNPLAPSTMAQNITYGSAYILRFDVTAASGGAQCASSTTKTAIPCPTGSLTLTDNGSALNDYPNGPTANATNMAKLNNQGFAEDQPVQLIAGAHSIVATYSGDANYKAGLSNALSITVAKAATATSVATNLTSVVSGGSVSIKATISTNSNGAGPTGMVQFANGTTSLGAVACVATSGAQNTATGTALCTATLTTPISALFPAPGRGPWMPELPWILVAMLALSAALYFAAVRGMEGSRRRVYAYAGLLAFGGGSSSGKTVTLNATYPGDTNYNTSTGSTVITVN